MERNWHPFCFMIWSEPGVMKFSCTVRDFKCLGQVTPDGSGSSWQVILISSKLFIKSQVLFSGCCKSVLSTSDGSKISQRRGANSKGRGTPSYDSANFSRKLHENEENWARREEACSKFVFVDPPLSTLHVDLCGCPTFFAYIGCELSYICEIIPASSTGRNVMFKWSIVVWLIWNYQEWTVTKRIQSNAKRHFRLSIDFFLAAQAFLCNF